MVRAVAVSPVAVAVLLLAGCGELNDRWKSARPATVPVQGVVTYQDYPLAEAIVVFQPTAADGIGASALTDEEGKFDLRTFPPELGAVPGSYVVTVMKMDDANVAKSDEGSSSGPEDLQKSLIPERYSSPTQSGLTADVPPTGTDNLAFHLKD